jgi:hypothetical protein
MSADRVRPAAGIAAIDHVNLVVRGLPAMIAL